MICFPFVKKSYLLPLLPLFQTIKKYILNLFFRFTKNSFMKRVCVEKIVYHFDCNIQLFSKQVYSNFTSSDYSAFRSYISVWSACSE